MIGLFYFWRNGDFLIGLSLKFLSFFFFFCFYIDGLSLHGKCDTWNFSSHAFIRCKMRTIICIIFVLKKKKTVKHIQHLKRSYKLADNIITIYSPLFFSSMKNVFRFFFSFLLCFRGCLWTCIFLVTTELNNSKPRRRLRWWYLWFALNNKRIVFFFSVFYARKKCKKNGNASRWFFFFF